MLKKIILFVFLLGFSTFIFAKNLDSTTLMVAPDNPSEWGYMGATVAVNKGPFNNVAGGITIPVELNDKITLRVFAMNAEPKFSASCLHIQIHEEGAHKLLFKLGTNWLVDCQYS